MRFTAVLFAASSLGFAQLTIKPVVTGGLHVEGNKLIDGAGRELTLQGTEAPIDLGLDYAGTMFSTIRQRWNMNMVRLPISVERSERDPAYPAHVAELVRRANQSELFVIFVAVEEGATLPTQRTLAFWSKWAAHFRDSPLVGFDLFDEPEPDFVPGHREDTRTESDWRFWRSGGADTTGRTVVGMQTLAAAIRATGASQPIIAMAFDDEMLMQGFGDRWFLDVANVIYEVCPMNRFHSSDAVRDRAFGFLASRVPLMASGWDPELAEDEDECRSVPRDFKGARALIRSHLEYFDAQRISWSASSFTPGKLIFNMNSMEPTELYKDIACGAVENPVQGAGLEVQLHQWSMTHENLISVSAGAGAIEIPVGGIAIGYALITETPELATTWPLPAELGGVALRITDAAGVERLAPLLYAGTGSINFLVDANTAPGLAHTKLLRKGSQGDEPEGSIMVERVAPGFFSATMNARGPAVGIAIERLGSHPLFECDDVLTCRTIPVNVSADGSTLLHIYGTGFRNAPDNLRATIGGHHVNIVESGPQPDVVYNDRLVLQIGPELAGLGEEDLVFRAGSRVSNVVRVHLR
jgi:uncharacterized protein (TIGR03437 family)